MSDTFVKDPSDVVKAGQVVSVRVKEVDADRKRIALSMKREVSGTQGASGRPEPSRGGKAPQGKPAGWLAAPPSRMTQATRSRR